MNDIQLIKQTGANDVGIVFNYVLLFNRSRNAIGFLVNELKNK